MLSFDSFIRITVSACFEFLESIFNFTGLIFLSPSVYASLKILRHINPVFVSEFVNIKVYQFMWHGIFWMIFGVTIISISEILRSVSYINGFIAIIVSVLLIIIGGLIDTSGQVISEQFLKKNTNLEPNIVLGIGGCFMMIICIFIAYPLVYIIPGYDFDCIINFNNTIHLIMNSLPIQIMSIAFSLVTYVFTISSIFLICKEGPIYSSLAAGYTIIFIWFVQIILFCSSDGNYGDGLSIDSIFEFIGILLLVYGVAIYSAPSSLSILVTKECCLYCGYDFSDEYDELIRESKEKTARLLITEENYNTFDDLEGQNKIEGTVSVTIAHDNFVSEIEEPEEPIEFKIEGIVSYKIEHDNSVNKSPEQNKQLSPNEDIKKSNMKKDNNRTRRSMFSSY